MLDDVLQSVNVPTLAARLALLSTAPRRAEA